MGRFCQIFVCATPGEGRCGAKGGGELLEAFEQEVERQGISPTAVLRNACTRRHEEGPVVFIYPDDVWYTRVQLEDVKEIVERHLVSGRLQAAGKIGSFQEAGSTDDRVIRDLRGLADV